MRRGLGVPGGSSKRSPQRLHVLGGQSQCCSALMVPPERFMCRLWACRWLFLQQQANVCRLRPELVESGPLSIAFGQTPVDTGRIQANRGVIWTSASARVRPTFGRLRPSIGTAAWTSRPRDGIRGAQSNISGSFRYFLAGCQRCHSCSYPKCSCSKWCPCVGRPT